MPSAFPIALAIGAACAVAVMIYAHLKSQSNRSRATPAGYQHRPSTGRSQGQKARTTSTPSKGNPPRRKQVPEAEKVKGPGNTPDYSLPRRFHKGLVKPPARNLWKAPEEINGDANNNRVVCRPGVSPTDYISISDNSVRESGPVGQGPALAGLRRRLGYKTEQHDETGHHFKGRPATTQQEQQSHGPNGTHRLQEDSTSQNAPRSVTVIKKYVCNYFINCTGNVGQNTGTHHHTNNINNLQNFCEGGYIHVYSDGRACSSDGSSYSPSSSRSSSTEDLPGAY